VVLPEKWAVLGTPEQTAAGAEPLHGPSVSWARAIARELGIDLVAGSIVEAVEGQERGANTSVHVGPDGEVAASYRKLHMFDVEVGGRRYEESAHEAPGEDIVLTRTAGGLELGLTICYDLRFPELYRILAVRSSSWARSTVTSPAAGGSPTRCCARPRRPGRSSSSSATSTRTAAAAARARRAAAST